MAISPEFRDYVLDLLAAAGPVSARAMFGGAGLYLDGTMFGLIARDELYFRVDDGNRGDYEAAGSQPFAPSAGKPYTLPYWLVPADVMDDAEVLCDWAGRAWEAARRSGTTKGRKR